MRNWSLIVMFFASGAHAPALTSPLESGQHVSAAPIGNLSSLPQRIEVSPLYDTESGQGFFLADPSESLSEQAIRVLRENFQIPVEVLIVPQTPVSDPASTKNVDLAFSYKSVPFCELLVRAHRVSGKQPLISGTAPSRYLNFRELEFSEDYFQRTIEMVKDALLDRYSLTESVQWHSTRKCVSVVDQMVSEAWAIEFSIAGRNFRTIAGPSQLFKLEELQFHLVRQGTAHVYPRNPLNGATKQPTSLPNLDDSGYLNSALFKTEVCRTSRAMSADGVFNVATTDATFAEISVFAYAHKMRSYYESLGFSEASAPQIQLIVHEVFSNTSAEPCALTPSSSTSADNALYTPAFGGNPPRIAIGDGSGNSQFGLKSLPYEADVVGHEYGHHVVFKVMTATTGQSLEIHEGMADIFVMLKNDDPCFSPSICPTNSSACYVKGQCLRSADNSLSFTNTATLPSKEHLRGQIISGMIWDLRKDTELSDSTSERLQIVRNLAYHSVAYLKPTSSRKDLVLALVMADQAHYDGKHSCQIFATARSRGLITETDDECLNPKEGPAEEEVPAEDENSDGSSSREPNSGETVESSPSASPVPTVRSSKSSSSGLCGTVRGGGGKGTNTWLLLLLAILPALFKLRMRLLS